MSLTTPPPLTTRDMTDSLGKAATNALVCGLGLRQMDRLGLMPSGPMTGIVGSRLTAAAGNDGVPNWQAGAVAGAMQSIGTDMLMDYVMPFAEQEMHIDRPQQLIQKMGAAAGGSLGAYYLLDPRYINNYGVGKVAAIGAMAEMASSMAWPYIRPMVTDRA